MWIAADGRRMTVSLPRSENPEAERIRKLVRRLSQSDLECLANEIENRLMTIYSMPPSGSDSSEPNERVPDAVISGVEWEQVLNPQFSMVPLNKPVWELDLLLMLDESI